MLLGSRVGRAREGGLLNFHIATETQLSELIYRAELTEEEWPVQIQTIPKQTVIVTRIDWEPEY